MKSGTCLSLSRRAGRPMSRFSSTLKSGSRLSAWGTMPVRARIEAGEQALAVVLLPKHGRMRHHRVAPGGVANATELEMEALGRDTTVSLAVSLNATDNATRDRLMPINRRYPIETLLEACRRYPLQPHRRITFEYILLEGINDRPADARRLAALLRPIASALALLPGMRQAGLSVPSGSITYIGRKRTSVPEGEARP